MKKSLKRRLLEYKLQMARNRAALGEERTAFFSMMEGLLFGYVGEFAPHEFGHYVASKVFGNDVRFEFRADGFHTLPYSDHVTTAAETFFITMGGTFADYAMSAAALIYANRARDDSTIRRPLAAAYSAAAAITPLTQSLMTYFDMGDFSYLDYLGIPKATQVAATVAVTAPLIFLGVKELRKTFRRIYERNGRI